jgi:hypothetical protein
MASEWIATGSAPDDYSSALFKYHSNVQDMHSAIKEGCGLCSLLWNTWLENSCNWRCDIIFSFDDEVDEKKNADYISAILSEPKSFRPGLCFQGGEFFATDRSKIG